ncbi:uncharacterized protein LOC134822098 [Bolinopsis microptera]|uniref:uncharacterized protein LOC134822098 n=1 Tax=Bolinopsis microptera TaxID=2820187 RepID=UPI0030793171
MILVVVVTLLLGVGCSTAQQKYSALQFGGGQDDKIQWYPDMSPFATQMSLCTWIKMRSVTSQPVVLHYFVASQHNIYLEADKDWNEVVETNLNLDGKFKAPVNEWYHFCLTWGEYILRAYFNGQEVGSTSTNVRLIGTGGKMSMGNRADAVVDPKFTFGGDVFKMNIFNRVLTSTEIRAMASDRCSEEEEKLNSNRLLKWEDILSQQRTGNVVEIPTTCSVVPDINLNVNSDIEERLRRIEERLNTAEQELKDTQEELQSTKQELTETNTSLTNTQEELQSNKQELKELCNTCRPRRKRKGNKRKNKKDLSVIV